MSARPIEVLNPDDWGEGLGFGVKALNVKSVARAKTPGEVVLVAAQHNLRKGNERHRHRRPIDPARKRHNTVLRGPDDPSVCAEIASNILAELGIEPARDDAIMCIETAYQPPNGWDVPQFYEEALTWASGRYAYILSAVVHRDQRRPHMHALALPVFDGRLAGASMTSGLNRLQAQRSDFMAHMRGALGLRPDREPKAPAKSLALTKLATSTGKGPKTHAAAAKSDAALERRTGAGMSNLIAHQPHSPPEQRNDLIAPTSYCAGLSGVESLFAKGVAAGHFPSAPTRPVTPAPRPLELQEPAPTRDRLGPPSFRPFRIPRSLLGVTAAHAAP